MKNIRFAILILILLPVSSCEDDFLDLKPLDSISEANVWEDLNLIELYVNDRYNELPHGFPQWAGGLRMTGITDESYHMHEARFLDKYTQGGLTSGSLNMYYFNGFWLDAYKAIRNQNIFLENIDRYEPNTGEEDRVRQLTAEIRFLRAYFYTELISRYGGVPLITTTFNVNSNFDVPRASFDDCVEFIVNELDEAIVDLPNRGDAIGASFGRITKGAAIGLKIRALMFNASPLFNVANDISKWQQVADACEELFNLSQYTLSSDYQGLFLNPMDSEVIFFKQFLDQFGFELVDEPSDFYFHYRGGHNINEWRFPNGDGGWISENPRQEFIDQYETVSGHIPVLGYTGAPNNLQPIINPNANDYNPNNPYQNRDPRLRYSVLYDNTEFKGRNLEMWTGGKDSRDPNVDFWWNGHRLGYGIRKSLDESWNLNDGVSGGQPWIYMRLSEFYLTYAEAQYHLGNYSTAVTYINQIRQRPGVNMPPINSSGDLLQKIKHERKIELAFESNRWYDARRWLDAEVDFAKDIIAVEPINNPSTGTRSYRYFYFEGGTGNRSFPQSHYLWPIPIEEILKSNLQQNPGY
ncbi:RagB/SusD family nutrient uptake outer membrane protein [Paucihalobacter ruber]|uniref:RagB/SusD family nutrient uptake outer membrane protein n=1 Tax=Paucihalobacter ruber TaxID=2567861 RepID=A0A506PQT3_9FLAO|nr:RagB/SusD family nutrient uptake outer membrane protein [Paucihalobacter ruber]TPV35565.1 RagB/SusD family nutrient uptake outer membrane protein [Paucihalobacter ruber]